MFNLCAIVFHAIMHLHRLEIYVDIHSYIYYCNRFVDFTFPFESSVCVAAQNSCWRFKENSSHCPCTKCYITLEFEIRFFEPLFFYFIKEWLQIKHKDTLAVWAGNKWELSTLSINKKRNALVITCIYTYRTSQTKNSDTNHSAGKINKISKQNCKT